jgi:hypothetical protein
MGRWHGQQASSVPRKYRPIHTLYFTPRGSPIGSKSRWLRRKPHRGFDNPQRRLLTRLPATTLSQLGVRLNQLGRLAFSSWVRHKDRAIKAQHATSTAYQPCTEAVPSAYSEVEGKPPGQSSVGQSLCRWSRNVRLIIFRNQLSWIATHQSVGFGLARFL